MRKIRPEVARQRIESFGKRFGKKHLCLAYHAAFPLALSPDLLYSLWANFQQDIYGKVLDIPWIGVADLLLSSLCDEVGYELYEMNLVVRNELLRQLQSDERFGKQRINELSDFLLEYVHKQLLSDNPDIQDFAKTQQWIALAYTQPTQAARELALAFSKLDRLESAELLRMASLMETFTEPLAEFQPLLIYARGMGNFARGDLEAAKSEFGKVLNGRNYIEIAGFSLPVPEQIKGNQSEIFQALGLKTFSFETITVDAWGKIINRCNREAKYFVEDLGNNDVTLEMVHIPGGTFTMGSPPDEAGGSDPERPQHKVTLSEFFMGKYEVTQAQYQQVMGKNPSYFKGNKRPVEQVSWHDALEFCKKLSQKAGQTYRLPSQAEWEYACRAGTITPFYFGETITTDLVNYNRKQTTEVGIFPPNPFGLYDMHGNVWEWCQDNLHNDYQDTPAGNTIWDKNDNGYRVLRGGSWFNLPEYCTSEYRLKFRAKRTLLFFDLGFRVVCSFSRCSSS